MRQSARKPTKLDTAYIARNFPKWLKGFEERIVNQLAIQRSDIRALHSQVNMMWLDSKEAREDNLPTAWELRRQIESLRVSMTPIVAHCERLMREKETLRKLYEANNFMAAPIHAAWNCPCADPSCVGKQPWSPSVSQTPRIAIGQCAFAKTHRMGVLCRICGNVPV